LNKLVANRIFGEAWDILLTSVICLIIKGTIINRTETPEMIINGNHGIAVNAYSLIKAADVTLKTGANHAHIIGIAKFLGAA
jgi:hypothetical protein